MKKSTSINYCTKENSFLKVAKLHCAQQSTGPANIFVFSWKWQKKQDQYHVLAHTRCSPSFRPNHPRTVAFHARVRKASPVVFWPKNSDILKQVAIVGEWRIKIRLTTNQLTQWGENYLDWKAKVGTTCLWFGFGNSARWSKCWLDSRRLWLGTCMKKLRLSFKRRCRSRCENLTDVWVARSNIWVDGGCTILSRSPLSRIMCS